MPSGNASGGGAEDAMLLLLSSLVRACSTKAVDERRCRRASELLPLLPLARAFFSAKAFINASNLFNRL